MQETVTIIHDKDYGALVCGIGVSDVLYEYALGHYRPNFPVPAIRTRTFNSLYKLGYVSAENNFDVDAVFEYYIKD